MSYAILINPSAREIKLTKTDTNFIPPKETTFLPFFGKERMVDKNNVFFMFENGELKEFRGLYVVVGENIEEKTMREIKEKVIWAY